MTSLKKIAAAAVVLALVAPALFAQNAKIDFRLNLAADDGKNFFNWSAGSKVVRDRFDAATGASVAESTYGFDVVRYDSADTKKLTLPGGLRGLLLFPVSNAGIAKGDNLTVTAEGKTVTVRYVHRGVAYELVTDNRGRFDVATGAKMARGLADNVGGKFVLKAEFVKSGGNPENMADLDWSKITLVPDTADSAASRKYSGTLAFAFAKDVLTIKGDLKEVK